MADTLSSLTSALADRYRIERELGQGGMATVYLAEDLKHQRRVAVKVLRPELAATLGPERFAREIAVAARLLHPHILGLLDSGEAAGFFYYVMPYVEGETLRERLARGGELPVPEAVRLLGEVAEALAVAHKAGVVHRDIKPENILLSGRHALVMDFGVAKAVSEASGRQQLTTAGVALGTPAYMAPEQATADPQMDGRVDIYALGVLGYEMLTGHTPFHGLNPQQTLAAHVTQAPTPVGQQRAGLSQALEAVVMKCLAKRPADRFQTADELAALLEPLGTPSGGMTPTHTQPIQATGAVGAWRRRLALGAAIILVVVLIAAVAVSLTRTRRPVAIAEHRQLTFTGNAWKAEISPDGEWLAYVSADSALLVQEIGGARAVTVLRGTWLRHPVWSSDGGSLLIGAALEGDMSRDAVWEVPRLGGEPKRLGSSAQSYAYSPDDRTIAWMANDTLVITERRTGREVHRRVVPDVSWTLSLRWSPDGRWLAVAAQTIEWEDATFLLDSASQTRHLIRRAAASPAWNGDGTALYLLSGQEIIRHQIDRRSGTPQDSGVTVLSGQTGATDFSLARDGRTLVLARGPVSSRIVAVTVPASGDLSDVEAVPLSAGTGAVGAPSVSPDGRWVAWTERAGLSKSVRVGPFGGGASRTVAGFEGSEVSSPHWAPDSRKFAYFADDSSQHILYTATPDGAEPRRVPSMPVGTRMPTFYSQWTWARQGLIVPDSGERGWRLVDPVSGSALPLASNDSLTGLRTPLLSPDGKTLVVARLRPFGFWDDVYQRGVGDRSGGWAMVPYDVPGDPFLMRWDGTGLYAAVLRGPTGPQTVRLEVWRARSPGEPFTPVLTGLRWCNGGIALSDDNRHLACKETMTAPDIWLVTGFDSEGR